MKTVNILDARNNLSKLIAAASDGNDIIIANRGKPVAKLSAIDHPNHTARNAAQWIRENPTTRAATRTPEEIDQQISREREGWE
ncbi:MAG TPA: type II toxin-antitoxin system prevent-host-death family antitoxin [Terrimesophilobacter sp.]|nr:type II toxin-antitoxin system prevent-host-death family antitoxin [Terrimesophilobacter sp.]